ncbi:lysozyme family protein [Serratia rubidaea]|uniref:hypothetical protein n=1 Tax=Serratia rubidaea TaxID=61652 RepID=UPI00157C6500|nr:hypothetical protein [Serratia rubidaea]QPR62218.1 hypothetical protein I6G83_15455 [Serratia rubidaea]
MIFELIYPLYVARAKANYAKKIVGVSNVLPWDSLEQKVKDVLVDFVYQGFSGERPMRSGMNNSRQEMISYIESNSVISSCEDGRHREKYLIGKLLWF